MTFPTIEQFQEKAGYTSAVPEGEPGTKGMIRKTVGRRSMVGICIIHVKTHWFLFPEEINRVVGEGSSSVEVQFNTQL